MKLHPHEPPRERLANLPTPVVALNNLAAHQGLPRLLMKRDDLTGMELSGNKIRKLEYVVAKAMARGADTLITHGGAQSNHCRATAALAAGLGLKLRLILRATKPQPVRDGNLFLDELFGAECSFHTPEEYNNSLFALVAEATADEERAGRKPFFFRLVPAHRSVVGVISAASRNSWTSLAETRRSIFTAQLLPAARKRD
jgi:D-cysteine desulfhydrase